MTMLLMMRFAWRMIESAVCLVGAYSELMISAWISAMGALSTKCSEMSDPLPRVGRGVFESEGAMASGRPSRIDVPRS